MDKVFQIITSETFIGCFFGLLGVFLGWVLNEYSTNRRAKPRLCFNIVGTPVDKRTEKEGRTNYDASDYSVEIYNVGQTPFVLESFTFTHKKKFIVPCYIGDQEKAILPYNSLMYTMNEEEADALEHHCGRLQLKNCTVFAYDVEGHEYKAKIDISWLSEKASFSAEDMVVTE